MTSFPYAQFEGTPMWDCVAAALADLKKNDDLLTTTGDRYVIGFLVQQVSQILPTSVLTRKEDSGVHNAVNEICNGIQMDDQEFQTRLGITRDELSAVLKKI